MASSSAAPLPSVPVASGWAALPRDVLWSLFTELGHREVLSGAGLACVPWRRLAREEPALWRRIDLTVPEEEEEDNTLEEVADDGDLNSDDDFDGESMLDDDDEADGMVDDEEEDGTVDDEEEEESPICQEETPAEDCSDSSGWKAMALAAIDRSAGQCETFWGRADDEVLLYLTDSAGKEQCSGRNYPRGPRSPKPFSVPMMRGLHSFELSGDSSFTNDVVMQIVDNCPNLKSLNITDVRYEDKWELKLLNNKCYRVKDLKPPAVFYEPDTDYSSDEDMS
ncbi:unnamed protein product [Urochloa decumbens]|uniref:F-box domain-containing protein n=1 Tax=Urochloa decumbens TaxID=240449 RepID=A0ABC8VJX8_9POAL